MFISGYRNWKPCQWLSNNSLRIGSPCNDFSQCTRSETAWRRDTYAHRGWSALPFACTVHHWLRWEHTGTALGNRSDSQFLFRGSATKIRSSSTDSPVRRQETCIVRESHGNRHFCALRSLDYVRGRLPNYWNFYLLNTQEGCGAVVRNPK